MFAVPSTRHTWRAASLLFATLIIGCSDAPDPVAPLLPAAPNAQLTPATIVTNTDDEGPGSLRQALRDAPDGVIQFDQSIAGQTIALTSGPLFLDGQVTIEGPAQGGITISGSFTSLVFDVFRGLATFRNLSIVNGRGTNDGGGIFVTGDAILDHVLVADNYAGKSGGGIAGASNAHLTLLNSTVSGNTADEAGGVSSSGTLTIYNSTIVNNTAITSGGGLVTYSGTAVVRNSIIANNTRGPVTPRNCDVISGSIFLASGANISNSAECGPGFSVADPLLGGLADNGGPTKTHALLFGSPGIDLGTNCTEATDQRYVARPQGSSCDVGAFEFDAFRYISVTIGPNVAVNARTGAATVTGTISCPGYAYSPLSVTLSQTQKTTGRFTTIVQAQATLPATTCASAPASWSVLLAPATGKFSPGTATGSVIVTSAPGGYVPANVTSPLKLFQVK